MKLTAISILLVAALEAAVVNGKGVKGQELRAPAWLNESRNLGKDQSGGGDDDNVDNCPDCFKCVGTGHVNSDGTKTVKISSEGCKSGEISWMCCIGTSGAGEGTCKTDFCDDLSVPGNNKCSGTGKTDTMEVTVDGGANAVTILAHDGQWKDMRTPFKEYTDVCGGNGKGTNVCQAIAVDISGCFNETPETPTPTESPTSAPETPSPTESPTSAPETPTPTSAPETPSPTDGPDTTNRQVVTPAPNNKGSGSGDPHFKTWTGDKYDYHGECDLVLVDHPAFGNGMGLRLHIRTTTIKYFSFIEKVALQIGDDILEFDNDVDNFLVNGAKVETNKKHHKTMLGGFVVRRDPKAISVRLHKEGKAKIDFHTRKNGFPAVIVDGGTTDVFKGSLGLLGDWETGKRIARDGKLEMSGHDATPFALEWQVRDTEPVLFKDARFPQYPTTCTPPTKSRLGVSSFDKEAEKACAHWEDDKEDCMFDVIATRDVLVAEEGHIVHIE